MNTQLSGLTPGIYLVVRGGPTAALIEVFDTGEAGKYWRYYTESHARTVDIEPDRAEAYVWIGKTNLGNQPAIAVRLKPDAVGTGRVEREAASEGYQRHHIP